MATRASLSIINKIVRRNLSVNDAADNLATNARFNQGALDDAIAAADIKVVNLLKIYKKESLLSHLWVGDAPSSGLTYNITGVSANSYLVDNSPQVIFNDMLVDIAGSLTVAGGAPSNPYYVRDANATSFKLATSPGGTALTLGGTTGTVAIYRYASGSRIPANWAIVSVEYTQSGVTYKSIEVPWDKFLLLTKYGNSSIFNSNFNTGYHTFRDGKIFHNAPVPVNIIRVKELVHPASLGANDIGSPAGFENAVASFATAQLLMKRMDRPEEAAYYEKVAYSFLQEYGIPESPKQETSDL